MARSGSASLAGGASRDAAGSLAVEYEYEYETPRQAFRSYSYSYSYAYSEISGLAL